MPALNKYKVTPVNRWIMAVGPTRTAKGYADIKKTKAGIRREIHKKRQKFEVVNQTNGKFIS